MTRSATTRPAASTPTSAPSAVAQAAVARAATSTRSAIEACANLGFFSRQLCVARECRRAELQAQPQCVARRRADEDRERRAQQ